MINVTLIKLNFNNLIYLKNVPTNQAILGIKSLVIAINLRISIINTNQH